MLISLFIIFYSFISVIIPINMQQINILDLFNESTNLLNENNPLIYSISNTWDGNVVENFHINTLGNIIYTNYLIWLIISSIILLLAMIGSIVITIKKSD